MKLLHNHASLGCIALLSEAAACARKAEISSEVFAEVLAQGGGGGAALERLRPFLASGDPSASRFYMTNAQKDLNYYNTMAEDTKAASDIAWAVLKTFDFGVASGGPQSMVLEF